MARRLVHVQHEVHYTQDEDSPCDRDSKEPVIAGHCASRSVFQWSLRIISVSDEPQSACRRLPAKAYTSEEDGVSIPLPARFL